MADNLEEYEKFVCTHKPQLFTSKIPEIYWKALHKKLSDEIFDADEYFTLVYDDYSQLYPVVTREGGIRKDDTNGIFLIDHAWTYEAEFSRSQLRHLPRLAKRMALLMELLESEGKNGHKTCEEEMCSKEVEQKLNGNGHEARKRFSLSEGFFNDENGQEFPKEELVEVIFDNMWRFNQTYQVQTMKQSAGDEGQNKLSSLEEQVSFWYIMDEFGSRIHHSDDATWEMKCLFYKDRGIFYSILFPTQDQCYGDIVTRDFIPNITDPIQRSAALYPWKPECFVLNEEINMHNNIDSILFSNEKRCNEMYLEQSSGVLYLSGKETYNVFTDVSAVAQSIKEPRFHLVENPDDADILWMADHFKDFKSLQESGKQFINQFPCENVLTCKDLLARVVNRVGTLCPETRGRSDSLTPLWFQDSFNLNLELPQFVRHFLKREETKEDNIWIIKPWNLGRSLDTHVTRNLHHIIRLMETGPKIAFKYIQNPVLLNREDVGKVKFHFRYMVAMTSVEPLIMDVDKVFWIGCANKPFSLDQFDVYEKHFTTMNYRSNVTLKQISHDEFPGIFDEQYPGYRWSDIEIKVHRIIKELFEAATSDQPPRGIGHCKMSRAYYALDFMLKWADDDSRQIQPVLLEVNFNPDCGRLVKYHPDSFHHLFTSLFMGEETSWGTVRL